MITIITWNFSLINCLSFADIITIIICQWVCIVIIQLLGHVWLFCNPMNCTHTCIVRLFSRKVNVVVQYLIYILHIFLYVDFSSLHRVELFEKDTCKCTHVYEHVHVYMLAGTHPGNSWESWLNSTEPELGLDLDLCHESVKQVKCWLTGHDFCTID